MPLYLYQDKNEILLAPAAYEKIKNDLYRIANARTQRDWLPFNMIRKENLNKFLSRFFLGNKTYEDFMASGILKDNFYHVLYLLRLVNIVEMEISSTMNRNIYTLSPRFLVERKMLLQEPLEQRGEQIVWLKIQAELYIEDIKKTVEPESIAFSYLEKRIEKINLSLEITDVMENTLRYTRQMAGNTVETNEDQTTFQQTLITQKEYFELLRQEISAITIETFYSKIESLQEDIDREKQELKNAVASCQLLKDELQRDRQKTFLLRPEIYEKIGTVNPLNYKKGFFSNFANDERKIKIVDSILLYIQQYSDKNINDILQTLNNSDELKISIRDLGTLLRKLVDMGLVIREKMSAEGKKYFSYRYQLTAKYNCSLNTKHPTVAAEESAQLSAATKRMLANDMLDHDEDHDENNEIELNPSKKIKTSSNSSWIKNISLLKNQSSSESEEEEINYLNMSPSSGGNCG